MKSRLTVPKIAIAVDFSISNLSIDYNTLGILNLKL